MPSELLIFLEKLEIQIFIQLKKFLDGQIIHVSVSYVACGQPMCKLYFSHLFIFQYYENFKCIEKSKSLYGGHSVYVSPRFYLLYHIPT